MNDASNSGKNPHVDDVRDELKNELLRAARVREGRQRGRRRRLGFATVAVLAVAIPGTLAVAGLGPDDEPQPAPPPLFAPGGAYADCPAEVQGLVRELDLTEYAQSPGYPVAGCPTVEAIEETIPTTEETRSGIFAPAGPYADCPADVQELVGELDDLSQYAQSSGYPVAGCPTIEAIEELLPTAEETRGADTLQEEARRPSPER